MDKVTDGRTDGQTDGRTDRPFYRDARTHLKRKEKSHCGRWSIKYMQTHGRIQYVSSELGELITIILII